MPLFPDNNKVHLDYMPDTLPDIPHNTVGPFDMAPNSHILLASSKAHLLPLHVLDNAPDTVASKYHPVLFQIL